MCIYIVVVLKARPMRRLQAYGQVLHLLESPAQHAMAQSWLPAAASPALNQLWGPPCRACYATAAGSWGSRGSKLGSDPARQDGLSRCVPHVYGADSCLAQMACRHDLREQELAPRSSLAPITTRRTQRAMTCGRTGTTDSVPRQDDMWPQRHATRDCLAHEGARPSSPPALISSHQHRTSGAIYLCDTWEAWGCASHDGAVKGPSCRHHSIIQAHHPSTRPIR